MPQEAWLLAAISALSSAVVYLGKRYLDDLVKTRDAALAGWAAQTEATKALTDEVRATRKSATPRRG